MTKEGLGTARGVGGAKRGREIKGVEDEEEAVIDERMRAGADDRGARPRRGMRDARRFRFRSLGSAAVGDCGSGMNFFVAKCIMDFLFGDFRTDRSTEAGMGCKGGEGGVGTCIAEERDQREVSPGEGGSR